ncbi:hypothetical protein NLI96_g12886 [Meripilus lineatus]|uniref:Uncharacterized protein n=1 Tax=Meripilus lineatus TaxID=2056292 RepID=A0AAD5URH2_9APHY|nr:hypothetical protein NLI96_g12886 [Physisporinus lineatus]
MTDTTPSSNPPKSGNTHFDFSPSNPSFDRGTIRIQRLLEDGSNWVLYKEELTSLVTSKGLKRYLAGTEQQPAAPEKPGEDFEADEKFENAKDVWESKHEAIKTLFYQTLPETLKLKIIGLTRASEAWAVITDEFDNQGDIVQVNLMGQMTALQTTDEEGDPRPALAKLEKLKKEYATAGGDLKPDIEKALIIGALPKSYRAAVKAIQASVRLRKDEKTGQRKPLTTSELLEAIRELARDEGTLDAKAKATDAALVASSSKPLEKDTCANCGKKGHWKKDCWAKGGDKEGKRPKRKGKGKGQGSGNANASVADSGEKGKDNYAFLVGVDFGKVESAALPPLVHLLDSGASRHFSPRRESFTNLQPIEPSPVNSADGRTFHATAQGDVHTTLTDGQRNVSITLKNVLYAPTMPAALISVSLMVEGGLSAHFEKDGCQILSPTRSKLLHVLPKSGLYPVFTAKPNSALPTPKIESALTSSPNTLSLTQFHRIMGHAYPPALRKMVAQGTVSGVSLEDGPAEFCDTCVQAKHTRDSFPQERSSPQAKAYGERTHSDVWGKSQVKTLGGKEYFVTFTDDATDEAVVFLMSKKSDTFTKYKFYEAWAKTQRGAKGIKELQSDRGGEYSSNEFKEYLASNGTIQRLTAHDSPQQNGKAERLNRTLVEHTRAMLIDAELPKSLWGEALMHATFLRNRTTTRSTPGSTPFEKATGNKPNLASVPRWGSKVWVLVENSGKLDPKSVEGRWVGFDSESKAHRVYSEAKRTVSVERNVRFEPETVPVTLGTRSEGEQVKSIVQTAPNVQAKPESTLTSPQASSIVDIEGTTSSNPLETSGESSGDPKKSQTHAPPSREPSGRTRKQTQWIRDLQAGIGSTGGRGAQKIPSSVLPPENARLVFEEMAQGGFPRQSERPPSDFRPGCDGRR